MTPESRHQKADGGESPTICECCSADREPCPTVSDPAILGPIDIFRCARCGNDHKGLLFHRLDNASDEFKWWAFCNYTNQPILLRVAEEEEAEDAAGGQEKEVRDQKPEG